MQKSGKSEYDYVTSKLLRTNMQQAENYKFQPEKLLKTEIFSDYGWIRFGWVFSKTSRIQTIISGSHKLA